MIFSKRQAHTIAQCISSRLLVLRLWEDNHIIYIDKHCLPKVPRQKGLHSMLEEARVICSVTLYVNKFASGSALKYTLHRGNSYCSASWWSYWNMNTHTCFELVETTVNPHYALKRGHLCLPVYHDLTWQNWSPDLWSPVVGLSQHEHLRLYDPEVAAEAWSRVFQVLVCKTW